VFEYLLQKGSELQSHEKKKETVSESSEKNSYSLFSLTLLVKWHFQ